MKQIKIFGVSSIPNQRIASGIHAIGGMGRNISKIGLTTASNFLFQPINSPKGMPVIMATTKAESTRTRLAQM